MTTDLFTEQLSLNVGQTLQAPLASSFKVAGTLSTRKRELYADDEVHVTIADPDGEILVSSYGRVNAIAFKKHKETQQQSWVERIHTIELGG